MDTPFCDPEHVMTLSQAASLGLLSILGLAAVRAPPPPQEKPVEEDWRTRSLYAIETRTLEGKPAKLSAYEGKVALVVNLASRCGYTPQYEGLEKLSRELKDKG